MEIKDALSLAAPVTNIFVESFLKPKINELRENYQRKKKLEEFIILNRFDQYLAESYNKFSIISTLVLKNQQRHLDSIYIPLTVVCSPSKENRFVIDDYPAGFIDEYQRILITDTAGMGKSTLLKKLFRSIIDGQKGIPFLVELRRLKKENDIINELLDQLQPINEEFDRELFLDLINKGGFIFLFDGFDEIPLEHKTFVTGELQSFISKAGANNYFIISSRPEIALSSFGDFMNFSIKPLEEEEAHELLRKYNNYGELSESLIGKISDGSNEGVKEFLTNPLLISLLYLAFEHKRAIPFKKDLFYRQVFDALFDSHDLTKGEFDRKKLSSLDSPDFHRVLRYIGYRCMIKEKIEFSKDEIRPLLMEAKTFTTLNFSESDFLKDLTSTVPLFVIDGVYYRWAHKSLQEYFAAQFIYSDLKEKQQDILLKLARHDDVEKFINTLDLFYSIDSKTFREVITYNLLIDFLKFIKTSYSYLPLSPVKEKRQMLTFAYDYIFFAVGTDEVISSEKVNNILYRKLNYRKIKYYGDMHFQPDLELPLGSRVAIYIAEKPECIILRLLAGKGEEFITKIRVKANYPKNLQLKNNEPVWLEGRKNFYLNQGDNFELVNRLIECCFEPVLTIDEKKAIEAIREIKRSIMDIKELNGLLDL